MGNPLSPPPSTKPPVSKSIADLVVMNANIINVYTREIKEGSVVVKAGRITRVGDVDDLIGAATTIIDAKGSYLSPGFIDAHLHTESSMVTITEFARVALLHGTTTIVIDPHEIANVLGIAGVKLFLKESVNLPLKTFITVPSCVPAAPNLETTGSYLTSKDLQELLGLPRVVGLAEMMNFSGVLSQDPAVLKKLMLTHSLGKVVDGHAPMVRGKELCTYVSAGIYSDHECVTADEALEKLRLGMWIMVREGSAATNLREIVKAVYKEKLDTRRLMLATDDLSPSDLLKGHVNKLVEAVIAEGYDPVTAIQMATINPATYFHLDHEIGGIAPGLKADFLLVKDPQEIDVAAVFSEGRLVAKEGKLISDIPKWRYPPSARKTVKVKAVPKPEAFAVKASVKKRNVTVRVMGVKDRSLLTTSETATLSVRNGLVLPDAKKDVLQAAVIERHKATGNIGLGFVRGFTLSEGALASSVAHDSHNVITVGVNWNDMSLAVKKIIEAGGGMIAVRKGSVLAFLSLPVAGLMSENHVGGVSTELVKLQKAARSLGCKLTDPFMTMSFMALPVIPKLKLTDKGLVMNLQFVDLTIT